MSMQSTYYGNKITLRHLGPERANSVLQFYQRNHEHFNRWEPDRPHNFYTSEFQQAVLRNEDEMFHNNSSYRFYVYLNRLPNFIIGCVCLSSIVRGSFQSAHIAYKIDQDYLRLGIAKEAVTLLLQVAFDEAKLHRLIAYIHPDNLPSIQFVENMGFTWEGIAHDFVCKEGVWMDHLVYSILSRH